MSLVDNLKTLTWHRHKTFERLPFVTAMMDGTLPLISYVAQLRGLAMAFSALEQTIALSQHALIAQLRPYVAVRSETLCADLAFFSPQSVPDILPAVRFSLDITRKIRTAFSTAPGKLIGYLYVLQGTTMGNQVHLPDIIRCFNLVNEAGATFYRGYGSDTDAQWLEFSALINRADNQSASEALKGVVEIYDALLLFHESLYPLAEGSRGFTAVSLNPEAGDHPVLQDPAILHAALRAGRRCRDEFSYYNHRYGERGRRFTDSDAAWLAALADQPAAVIADQVLWLGRLLSARGMPFLLMERQLELLAEELIPQAGSVRFQDLQAVGDDLRQQRCRVMSQQQFDEACLTVAKIISPRHATDFPDLPLLLVAAYIDMRAGMPECLASLFSWLRDAAVMTEAEIEAAREALAAVQTATTVQ